MHIWLRHETRDNESRAALTPAGAAQLMAAGYHVTVEDSPSRVLESRDYVEAGCTLAETGSWVDAPTDAVILGLKELPDDGTPLRHRHIMFGHAFKGQISGQALLQRFQAGGGTLLDLEYLTQPDGRRVAAFGYWAGYAGAAVSLMTYGAQQTGHTQAGLHTYAKADDMLDDVRSALRGVDQPNALVIGALGRVGAGAIALCDAVGVPITRWDMAETAHGGPFPEILDHTVFFNCILARPGTPVFVPETAVSAPRALRVIGDIACDPDSDYNPVPLYDDATSWAQPAVRIHDDPPLDVMAIDNLPSLLPAESTDDFAGQLLPHLIAMRDDATGVWARAKSVFDDAIAAL